MNKKKHEWHCGTCHSTCKVLRKQKGTKYIYCPNCDQIVAYYNPIPLIAGAIALAPKLLKGAKTVASAVGIGGKAKEKEETQKDKQIIIHDSLDRPNRAERTINRVLYGDK